MPQPFGGGPTQLLPSEGFSPQLQPTIVPVQKTSAFSNILQTLPGIAQVASGFAQSASQQKIEQYTDEELKTQNKYADTISEDDPYGDLSILKEFYGRWRETSNRKIAGAAADSYLKSQTGLVQEGIQQAQAAQQAQDNAQRRKYEEINLGVSQVGLQGEVGDFAGAQNTLDSLINAAGDDPKNRKLVVDSQRQLIAARQKAVEEDEREAKSQLKSHFTLLSTQIKLFGDSGDFNKAESYIKALTDAAGDDPDLLNVVVNSQLNLAEAKRLAGVRSIAAMEKAESERKKFLGEISDEVSTQLKLSFVDAESPDQLAAKSRDVFQSVLTAFGITAEEMDRNGYPLGDAHRDIREAMRKAYNSAIIPELEKFQKSVKAANDFNLANLIATTRDLTSVTLPSDPASKTKVMNQAVEYTSQLGISGQLSIGQSLERISNIVNYASLNGVEIAQSTSAALKRIEDVSRDKFRNAQTEAMSRNPGVMWNTQYPEADNATHAEVFAVSWLWTNLFNKTSVDAPPLNFAQLNDMVGDMSPAQQAVVSAVTNSISEYTSSPTENDWITSYTQGKLSNKELRRVPLYEFTAEDVVDTIGTPPGMASDEFIRLYNSKNPADSEAKANVYWWVAKQHDIAHNGRTPDPEIFEKTINAIESSDPDTSLKGLSMLSAFGGPSNPSFRDAVKDPGKIALAIAAFADIKNAPNSAGTVTSMLAKNRRALDVEVPTETITKLSKSYIDKKAEGQFVPQDEKVLGGLWQLSMSYPELNTDAKRAAWVDTKLKLNGIKVYDDGKQARLLFDRLDVFINPPSKDIARSMDQSLKLNDAGRRELEEVLGVPVIQGSKDPTMFDYLWGHIKAMDRSAVLIERNPWAYDYRIVPDETLDNPRTASGRITFAQAQTLSGGVLEIKPRFNDRWTPVVVNGNPVRIPKQLYLSNTLFADLGVVSPTQNKDQMIQSGFGLAPVR